jgi:hypothetical protein
MGAMSKVILALALGMTTGFVPMHSLNLRRSAMNAVQVRPKYFF